MYHFITASPFHCFKKGSLDSVLSLKLLMYLNQEKLHCRYRIVLNKYSQLNKRNTSTKATLFSVSFLMQLFSIQSFKTVANLLLFRDSTGQQEQRIPRKYRQQTTQNVTQINSKTVVKTEPLHYHQRLYLIHPSTNWPMQGQRLYQS